MLSAYVLFIDGDDLSRLWSGIWSCTAGWFRRSQLRLWIWAPEEVDKPPFRWLWQPYL